jgi:hypothetical protein
MEAKATSTPLCQSSWVSIVQDALKECVLSVFILSLMPTVAITGHLGDAHYSGGIIKGGETDGRRRSRSLLRRGCFNVAFLL